MILTKNKKRLDVSHKSRSIHDAAKAGMEEISRHVEHFGPQMTELAQSRGNGSNSLTNAMNTVVTPSPVVDRNGPAAMSEGQGSCSVMQSNIVGSLLPLSVKRNSYTIVGTVLPFALFCPVNLVDNYATIFNITGTLPAGCVITTSFVTTRTTNDTLRFTYVVGAFTDTIDITSNFAVPYTVILEMLKTDYFTAKGIKYTAETGNFDDQFNCSSIYTGRSTFMGLANVKAEPVSAYKRADQQQNNIINIDASFVFNGRRYLVLGMAATPPGVATTSTIKLDVFMNGYDSSTDFDGAVCNF